MHRTHRRRLANDEALVVAFSADCVSMTEKLSDEDAAVFGLAGVIEVAASLAGLVLIALGVFVFDSDLLRGLSIPFFGAAVGADIVIHRRKARLGLHTGRKARWKGIRHFKVIVPALWLAALVSAFLIFALPEGTATITFGIATFLLLVLALNLTYRGPRADG